MKKDIHPEYFDGAQMTCSCGAVFTSGSTRELLNVETCSQCHPFFTGKQKIVDSTGRVDRFKKMTQKAEDTKLTRSNLKSKQEKKELRSKKQEQKIAA